MAIYSKRLIREFLHNSSISGLRLLLLAVNYRYAKKLWIIFMTLTIIYTHYIIFNLTVAYLQAPTEIRMSTDMVHVVNSPFVGVALCSANKFSRRKLKQFAENVIKIQETFYPGLLTRNTTEMMESLLVLAGFYVFPYDDYEFGDPRLEKLHQLLTVMYNTTDYPSPRILHELAPDCENLVLRILLFGRIVDTRHYIRKRMTFSSVCCLFNYKRKDYTLETDTFSSRYHDDIKFEANSVLNSVQFVLQDNPDDFTFMDWSNNAFQAFLFPSDDYPQIQSQTMGVIVVSYNNDVQVPIRPIFMSSRKTIRQFKPTLRRCYYPEEGQQLLNQNFYSLDECLLICRMRSMVNYCGCVNPSSPAQLINAPFCNLLDLPCLTQWKRIWYGWNYFDYVSTHEDRLQQQGRRTETQRCDRCYPACDNVDYKLYINKLPMVKASHNNTYRHGLLQNITDTKPVSILKLHFMQRYAEATIEDTTGDWVMLLSRFGGIMSLMYGFSIMSLIEIIYYITVKGFTQMYKAVKGNATHDSSKTVIKTLKNLNYDQNQMIKLYWHEITPKPVNLHKLYNKTGILKF